MCSPPSCAEKQLRLRKGLPALSLVQVMKREPGKVQ